MKKLLTIIIAAVLAVSLVACSKEKKTETVKVEKIEVSDVYELTDVLYAKVPEDNRPFLMTEILNEDNFEWLSFIPYENGLEGVVNQPMMGSIAHKVVIIKAKDSADAKRVADLLKTNADPRWLVCVEADDVRTATNENLALLMLTTNELGMGDKIMDAFNALDAKSVNAISFEAPVFDDEPIEDDFAQDEAFDEDMEPVEDETIGEEQAPVEEAPVEEAPVEEAPVDVDVETETQIHYPTVEVPVFDNTPEVNQTPTVEETPVIDETPTIEETPTVDENPVVEQTPVIETPSVDEAPVEEAPAEETPAEETPAEETAANGANIITVVDSLYASIPEDNKPFLMTEILSEDNFEWLSFIPYEEGLQGVVNQPMMGSIAHKVVIIKCKDNADAKRVEGLLKTNANPRWLICVEADDVRTATNGNLAFLMLTTKELGMGDKIFNAFTSLDASNISFEME